MAETVELAKTVRTVVYRLWTALERPLPVSYYCYT